MQRTPLIVAIVASLGLAGALAYAANSGAITRVSAPSARAALQTLQSAPAGRAFAAAQSTRSAKPAPPPPPPPTVEEVGDVDSFGRNLRWLGVASGFAVVSTDCASILAQDPDATCQQVSSQPGVTSFTFNDVARIRLPAGASNSLLCHWFSPQVTASFTNSSDAPVLARLTSRPSVTVENPVLNDPALIDPSTGAAFGGKLTTSVTGTERLVFTLAPWAQHHQTLRGSQTCIGGMLSKRALVEGYGLTEAQAASFFASPTTLRLNIQGVTASADEVTFSVGLRVIGD